MRKYLVIFILLFSTPLWACQCIDAPSTFLSSLKHGPEGLELVTLEVEVLAVDTVVTRYRKRETRSVISRLKVLHAFGNADTLTEVMFANGNGANCLRMLYPNAVGERYIISGFFSPMEQVAEAQGHVGPYFFASLCMESILRVLGDEVVGNFSKNKVRTYVKRMERRGKISEKWAENYRLKNLQGHPNEYYEQRVSYSKVIRKLKM